MTTFGTDPEFLIVDKHGDCKSAISVVKVDNESPIVKGGNRYYYDNVLAECTVKPGENKEEVLANLKAAIKDFAKIVVPYRLATRASAEFPDEELTHPDAIKVNCSPDTCAYSMEMKRLPVDVFERGNLRSCGGHIHLGENFAVKNEEGPEPIFTVYMLDLFLGIPSLFLDNDPTSVTRRTLYGEAGRFRKKEYGIEYRSLSNFWLQSPTFASLIYDLSVFAVEFVESGKINEYWTFDEEIFYESDDLSEAFKCIGYDAMKLKRAIDTSDREAAQPFLKIAQSHLPTNMSKAITSLSKSRSRDLYQEWGI